MSVKLFSIDLRSWQASFTDEGVNQKTETEKLLT